MYTVGSLFSGIGGIDLAFVRAGGFDIRWQIEIEPFCQAVLRKHAAQYWPNAKVFEDVTRVTGNDLGTVDIMVGGFPCQDISVVGNRKGIKEGTRSGLWIEFARLISEIRPRCVLLENVAAITTLGGTQVIADLTAQGYDAEWGIIPASAVGAPHRRERWFCVAYAKYDGSVTTTQRGINGSAVQRAQGGTHSTEQSQGLCASSVVAYTAGCGDTRQSARSREARQGQIEIADRRQSQHQSQADRAVGNPQCSRCEGHTWRRAIPFPTNGYEQDDRHSQPIMGRAVDGLSRQLDIARWPARPAEQQKEWEAPRTTTEKQKDRAARIKALGNAVVPQVVEPIAVAIREYLTAQDS